jgi:hypothetical protein
MVNWLNRICVKFKLLQPKDEDKWNDMAPYKLIYDSIGKCTFMAGPNKCITTMTIDAKMYDAFMKDSPELLINGNFYGTSIKILKGKHNPKCYEFICESEDIHNFEI